MTNSRIITFGHFLVLFAALCMVMMTGACIKNPYFVCHPNYYQTLKKEDVAAEITRLEEAVKNANVNSRISNLYLELAQLYSHYNNPDPDYHRSLELFEKYLLLNPHSWNYDEVHYLKNIIQQLVTVEKKSKAIEKQAASLKGNNDKLKDEKKKLTSENQEMQEAIEKLKLLEYKLEEKRLYLK